MAIISMKKLLEAGVHFGHQTRRWNPKMASTHGKKWNLLSIAKTKISRCSNFIKGCGKR